MEDRQLIADCLKGQIEAYSELVRRYQDRLYNAVFRFLNDAEDAQDVTQEAFVSAWQALSRFKGNAKFFTWIYRIAINHAIDLKRKRKVSRGLEVRLSDELQPVAAGAAPPEEAVERREEAEKLRKALNLLSAEHRMVLILKDIDGMKYEEMADTLEVPIGTIRSRLHRARLELRVILERQEKEQAGAC